MKKQLLSTSAIALGVAMASPAAAQQWDLAWGGFANTHVGISDIDNDVDPNADQDGVNVFTNSELIFSPSVTLDNGLTFGFSVQIEALNTDGGSTGDSTIDESYVTISSDMLGRIVLGSENSAGYLSMVAAPQVGSMPINSGSQSAFVPLTGTSGFRQAGISSYTEVAGNNDVQRITYFTPSFNGLTVGVSYAPSNSGNASNNAPVDFDAAGDVTDIFDIGLNYNQSFQGVDIALGARWGTGERQGFPGMPAVIATAPTAGPDGLDGTADDVAVGDVISPAVAPVGSTDPETWGIGGSISTAGFTFGVGYAENDADTASGAGDSEGLSIGVAYDLAGPWTIGLEGYFGETDNGAAPDSEMDVVKLAGSRTLGSGVSWDVYYMYVSSENAANQEIEGNVIATAINLSF